MTLQTINASLLVLFAFCAMLQYRNAASWPRGVWRITLFTSGFLLFLTLAGCGFVLLSGPSKETLPLVGRILFTTAPQIVLVLLMFPATLSLHYLNPLRRRVPPLLPIVRRITLPKPIKHRCAAKLSHTKRIYLVEIILCAISIFLFSWTWLSLATILFDARVAPERAEFFLPRKDSISPASIIMLHTLILFAPFAEEIIYRGFIQQYLYSLMGISPAMRTRCFGAYVVPIVITAAIWALVHTQVIIPDWVKWVQIFGIGLVLGIARFRLGLEACIILHLLFNILGGFFSPSQLVKPEIERRSLKQPTFSWSSKDASK